MASRSLAELLAAQPAAVREHPDFPRLERMLRESAALRRVRLPRAAYALLDEPRLEPRCLGDFHGTYRLPDSPFFALFLSIKRERRARLAAARLRRQEEIRAIAGLFPSRIRGFIEYLEAAEGARNGGIPIGRRHLLPRSKKRAREMALFGPAEWMAFLAGYVELLRGSYRRIALPDTERLLACMLLELYPDPVSGRLPPALELRSRFRALSKVHHPDSGGDAALFRLLVAARDRLLP